MVLQTCRLFAELHHGVEFFGDHRRGWVGADMGLRQIGKQARIVDVERGRVDHVAETDVDQDRNASILEARIERTCRP